MRPGWGRVIFPVIAILTFSCITLYISISQINFIQSFKKRLQAVHFSTNTCILLTLPHLHKGNTKSNNE